MFTHPIIILLNPTTFLSIHNDHLYSILFQYYEMRNTRYKIHINDTFYLLQPRSQLVHSFSFSRSVFNILLPESREIKIPGMLLYSFVIIGTR